jgi:peptide/nickel transport system permease protein
MSTSAVLAGVRAAWDHDLAHDLRRHPSALVASTLLLLILFSAAFAPFLSPQNPYDLTQLSLNSAELPPAFAAGGTLPYLLGTDPQGRDVLSAILYGSRVSLLIGLAAVALSATIGVVAGLLAGYHGGFLGNLIMRVGDTVLSLPTLLIAILFNAIFRTLLPSDLREFLAPGILVLSIAAVSWVQYARLVRAATLVEANREYVQAARIIGVGASRIMRRHILPNIMTPVLVTATLNLGLAILAEATLSFLGVGMPVNQPSLGTLIRTGNEYFFSGSWWVVLFPALQLCLIILSVNLVADWLRDAINPKLR